MNNTNDSIGDYASQVLHQIANGIPRFLGALVIWIVAYFVAKALGAIVSRVLHAWKLNEHMHRGRVGGFVQRALPNPSAFLAKVVFWIVYVLGITMAIGVLGIPVLTNIVNGIYAYLPNVLAALIIFIVASAIAGGVATFALSTMGDTPSGRVVAAAGPTIVMAIAAFMILTQLKIAPSIVIITYTGIIATLTLAFGLGGRDVAAQMLQGLYEKGRQYQGQVVADAKTGAARARRKGQNLRDQAS